MTDRPEYEEVCRMVSCQQLDEYWYLVRYHVSIEDAPGASSNRSAE